MNVSNKIKEMFSEYTFIKIEEIKKGWSKDQKFYLEDYKHRHYCLRISPVEEAVKKEQQFSRLQKLTALPLNIPKPLRLVKDEKIYSLLTWVEGNSLEDEISKLNFDEQHKLGLEAGKILFSIHQVKIETKISWQDVIIRKTKEKLTTFADLNINFPKKEKVISYIEDNINILYEQNVVLNHGDFHIGNMVIDDNNKLGIVDFDKMGIEDWVCDFKPFVWNVWKSPLFATGLIDGYFKGEVPKTFFQKLSVYAAINLISHIPWAMRFDQKEVDIAYQVVKDTLYWFDDFKEVVPKWYNK